MDVLSSISGMMLTGEMRYSEQNLPHCQFVAKKSRGVGDEK